MSLSKPAIIIDNGTLSIKAGLAGEDLPRVHVPPVVGRPRLKLGTILKKTDHYVGGSATSMQENLDLTLHYPLKHGIIHEWDNMEVVWDHTFRVMGAEPSQHPVLISESPLNTRLKRHRLAEIMFETYRVPALYIANTANLALYASGKISGLVIDSGERATRAVPIYEGYTLNRDIITMNVGGESATDYLRQLLALRGISFQGEAGLNAVRTLKENNSYVAEDFNAELQKADLSTVLQKNYTLPDGRVITMNTERFRVPEIIFQPSPVSRMHQDGVAVIAHESVQRSSVHIRSDMYNTVVLAGGNTMFPGLPERIKKELTALAPPSQTVNVEAAPDRENLAWKGGAKLAASEKFEGFWITMQEYAEHGSRVIHQKVI